MSITQPVEALNLDLKQQKSFVSFVNNLPEKPSSTLRFFNHGDFYTVHGDDAKFASSFTGNIIKYMGEEPKLSYVCLRKSQFETFVRELLLVKQYRVEVYLKTAANKVNDWKVEYKGSPGNLAQFEEILFDNAVINFSNYVMGVKIVKGKLIAVACVNSTEVKFQLCQINDNECFTELETLIAQVGPRECIIPHGDSPELVALRKVLERNNVLIATVKRSDFAPNDIMQDLNRLLFFHDGQQRNAATMAETKMTEALGCLNAVIKFLNLTADEQNFNQYKMTTMEANRFVRLDNAALYSLNILPKPGGSTNEDSVLLPNSTKSFSLMGVLDTCVTSQGRRLLEQWIKQPLKDFNLIEERLDIVECLVKNPEIRYTLRTVCLPRLTDLLLLSKKLSSKKANLQDCYRVYQVVACIPNLLSVLDETGNSCIKSVLMDPISEIKDDLAKYQSMIDEILDFSLVDKGEFLVKGTVDPDLNEIYEKKTKVEEKMQKALCRTAEDLGFEADKTIKLECTDQHGYFYRLTLKEEHALRSNKRYQIIDAIKGGVRFVNDRLRQLNDEYAEAKAAYEEQQKVVIGEVFAVAAGYSESLRNLNMNVAAVDVLTSFANVAVSARLPYVRPKLLPAGSGVMKLRKVRHPCIEQQDHVSFIPNNVEFNKDGSIFHIITGPNMCGKSTYIKSVGVCALMAQIGSLVPCDYAEMSLVDAVLARVGAEDCQLKGLSTFMIEMIEAATIIQSATANSLVIIDELGRGTSTYDGCGIAWAIAEHLATEIKCFSLFATHFHEITRLADRNSAVNNLHVTAVTTNNTITPLFQVREGACDNSYGIHCARMANFPSDVIEWAIAHQNELEHSAGIKFIKDYDQSLKRKTIQEGDKTIKEVLQKIKALETSGLSDEDLRKEVDKIKAELLSSDNLFIKGLLS